MIEKFGILSKQWEEAKAHYIESREKQTYYDEEKDAVVQNEYYQEKEITNPNRLHTLLEETHQQKLSYTPHRFVYPWVDLQENGLLKSLYSGTGMDPLDVIEKDIRLLEKQGNGIMDLSSSNLLNCEHVVPQSWFNKKEPMRGDLHHLFACEPTCNSRRGNHPYYDFQDYQPEVRVSGVKEGCGKTEEDKFEPEYGKGIVARATMYFIIRYPNLINSERVNVPLLLQWHQSFPVSLYERHRNLAIWELQGNRNPFIDFPTLASTMIL